MKKEGDVLAENTQAFCKVFGFFVGHKTKKVLRRVSFWRCGCRRLS